MSNLNSDFKPRLSKVVESMHKILEQTVARGACNKHLSIAHPLMSERKRRYSLHCCREETDLRFSD